MSKRTPKNKFFAFSLVELMAAVAIVAILVSLALPRFRAFIANSRMAEAKANLGILATLAQSYKIEYSVDTCPSVDMGKGDCTGTAKANQLGFRVVDCDSLRYRYKGCPEFFANSNISEIYPGCNMTNQDRWTINENRFLNHNESAVKNCK